MKTASLTRAAFNKVDGLTITAPCGGDYSSILTSDALAFLVQLHRNFNSTRKSLLNERADVQKQIDLGWMPHFSPESSIRETPWQVAKAPRDLQDRRVEITGPVERKMIINALNSGAKIFMADLEDSNSPGWHNTMQGQINLRDAVQRTISYTNPENGKEYTLNSKSATLMVRPRGWHLEEKHLFIDNEPASASLVDFGLYFFHNAIPLLQRGSGPYFYLPKIESAKEARLWNDVFVFAQNYAGIAQGTIKATVLVETILATFQLHEILWVLKHHSAGLNCGRWDYIFSFIKKFRNIPGHIFPDRSQVTMTTAFMRAYTQLVVKTCHQRGAHAIGGMAAQIPIKNNPAANEAALAKVKADKIREVKDGHDGTWVAHPGLVPIALEVFDEHMPGPNQLRVTRHDFTCTEADLLQVPGGTITKEGICSNINIGIIYMESWLRGNGAAAIHNLMEDAATAEISRTQLWQWLHNKAAMSDGKIFTHELYEEFRDKEIENIRETIGSRQYQESRFVEAICLFNKLVVKSEFEEFLTLSAYDLIVSNETRDQYAEPGRDSNLVITNEVGPVISLNNHLYVECDDITSKESNIVHAPGEYITKEEICANINIGIAYIERRLTGNAATGIHTSIEEAAVAETSRKQLWQWLQNKVTLSDGRRLTHELYEDFRDEEIENLRESVGSREYHESKFVQAICLFNKLIVKNSFEDISIPGADPGILSNDAQNNYIDKPPQTTGFQVTEAVKQAV